MGARHRTKKQLTRHRTTTHKRIAASKVFGMTELLELIILALTQIDILTRAARVAKAWYQVIKTSPRISHHLGISTALTRVVLAPVAHHNLELQLNIPVYPTLLASGPTAHGCKSPYTITRVRRPNCTDILTASRTISNLAGDLFSRDEALESVNGGSASWKRMHATSPPCTTMQVRVFVSGRLPDFRPMWCNDERIVTASLRRMEGITLGDVEEVTTEMVRSCWDERRHGKVVKMFRVLEELGR